MLRPFEEERGWLYYLAVEPGVQRKGLGRAMVRYAEKWLRAQWGTTDTGRKARFYTMTPAGRRQLAHEVQEWRAFAAPLFSRCAL